MNLPQDFLAGVSRLFPKEEAELFLAALSEDPAVSIRVNLEKNPQMFSILEGLGELELRERVPWCGTGYYLARRPVFTLDPLFHAGGYYVQEASSMFLEQVIRQHLSSGRPVKALDLCAAPGGKSTLLESLLPKGSLLVCNEIVRSRAVILAENIQKWGCSAHTVVSSCTPAQVASAGMQFDIIVADAPCSGEGMFRKDSQAVAEWSKANVDMCAVRQREILNHIWPALRPGGTLIYSTCTFNTQENEANTTYLMEKYGAEPLELKTKEEWGVAPAYHFYPHRVKGEGFYVSALRKPMEEEWESGTSEFAFLSKGAERVQTVVPEVCKGMLRDPQNYVWSVENGKVMARELAVAPLMRQLADALPCVSSGLHVATLKGNSVIPAQTLAMSCGLERNAFENVEVSKSMALSYLHGDSLMLPQTPEGYVLLTYAGLPLGFVKNLGSRANNLYPKEWRIRMSVCNN